MNNNFCALVLFDCAHGMDHVSVTKSFININCLNSGLGF